MRLAKREEKEADDGESEEEEKGKDCLNSKEH